MGQTGALWPIPSHRQFQHLSAYIARQTGLIIPPNKAAWLRDRVESAMRALGLAGWQDLLLRLEAPGGTRIRSRLTEALSTYETRWFRDHYPFDALREIMIPAWLERDSAQAVRIWSQACASGEETWSLAFVLREAAAQHSCHALSGASVLGSDLSPRVLAAARSARYDGRSMAPGLDGVRRARNFTAGPDGYWTVKRAIQARVRFQPVNVLGDIPDIGRFHAIFSRNVLMYFSRKNREVVLQKLVTHMVPHAYLVLGVAETLPPSTQPLFHTISLSYGTIYQLR